MYMKYVEGWAYLEWIIWNEVPLVGVFYVLITTSINVNDIEK